MLKITLVTLGHKMPGWVEQAVSEFTKRLRDTIAFSITEIPLKKRGKSQELSRIFEQETAQVLQMIPRGSYLIALDAEGTEFTSVKLATKLEKLQQQNSHLCFLIGGPEGLSQKLLDESQEKWSLSKLTLPHPLVRIVFVEAIYRALCILSNHPYHK